MITEQMTSAKLEILNTRDKYIKSVLADVNKELLKLRKHRLCYYQEILNKLILQAMYQVILLSWYYDRCLYNKLTL